MKQRPSVKLPGNKRPLGWKRNAGKAATVGLAGSAIGAFISYHESRPRIDVKGKESELRTNQGMGKGLLADVSTEYPRLYGYFGFDKEAENIRLVLQDIVREVRDLHQSRGIMSPRFNVGLEKGQLIIKPDEKLPSEDEETVRHIALKHAPQISNIVQKVDMKIYEFMKQHHLRTIQQLQSYVEKSPLDWKQIAGGASAGAGIGLGATLLGVLGLQGLRKTKKLLIGKSPVRSTARQAPPKNEYRVMPQATQYTALPTAPPVTEQVSQKTFPEAHANYLQENGAAREKVRQRQEKTERLLEKRLQHMAGKAGLSSQQFVRLKVESRRLGLTSKDAPRIRVMIEKLKAEGRANGAPPQETKEQAKKTESGYAGLSPITWGEMERFLRRIGFEEVRRGKHRVFHNAERNLTTELSSPHGAKDISTHLLAQMLREIRISPAEFNELRRKH